MKKKHYLYLGSLFVLLFCMEANAAILFQDDFEGYSDSPSAHEWQTGSAVAAVNGEGYNGSRCVKISYTVAGTTPYWFGWNGLGAHNRPSIYIRFYFKTAADAGGNKFCKLFGKREGTGYANTTVPLEQSGGRISYVRYGAGFTTDNDTQTLISLEGASNDSNVVIQTTSSMFYPDNQWHCFEFYMKYNTDDNRDGENKVWIDGILSLHATNVINRNNLNTRAFDSIHFANYTATSTSHVRAIWYDNVVVSDDYIGPIGFESTSPPLQQPNIVQDFLQK